MKQVLICPVCNSEVSEIFLVRKNVAIHQHLVMDSPGAAHAVNRGDLTLAYCTECAFVFNSTFDQEKLVYGELYENTQTYSPFFNNYIDELINYLIKEKNVQNCRIVEVGCGQGIFLKRLIERGADNTGYGFDPSYRGPKTTADGRITFFPTYYGPGGANIEADVVICRHVIEHVPDPVDLLKSMLQALSHSPDARLFIETPSVEWILRNAVFWDFFYEHCSYFTSESLASAVKAAGFAVENVFQKFNGQYLWLEAVVSGDEKSIAQSPEHIHALTKQFAGKEERLTAQWSDVIKSKSAQEKIAVWGAGAKGATFISLIDSDCKYFDCVVDINPKKQGKFIPGTGHEIVGVTELANRNVSSAILLNPNYRDEVMEISKGLPSYISLIEMENM
jgi:SAM-dependent methyltransferase